LVTRRRRATGSTLHFLVTLNYFRSSAFTLAGRLSTTSS
jgi:hypothetical protein